MPSNTEHDAELGELRAQLRRNKLPRALPQMAIGEFRDEVEAAMSLADAPPSHDVTQIDLSGVTVERIVPPNADGQLRILYLHGGGYAYCSARTHRPMVAALSEAAAAISYSVNYRLAPEHPFPAAVDDVVQVHRRLIEEDGGAENLVIAGDSAGAGLAIAVAVALKAAHVPQPAALYLISPWVDLTMCSPVHETHSDRDLVVTREALEELANHYAGDAERGDPRISIVFADLRGLPPMLIQVGSEEVLLGDALALAAKAAKDRVAVTLEVWPHMPHVWHLFGAQLSAARLALAQAAAWMRHHNTTNGDLRASAHCAGLRPFGSEGDI